MNGNGPRTRQTASVAHQLSSGSKPANSRTVEGAARADCEEHRIEAVADHSFEVFGETLSLANNIVQYIEQSETRVPVC